jgi:hypothetical protein
MKRIYLVGLLTATFILMLGSALWAQDNPITVSFTDPNRPGTVKVHVLSGDLTIKTHTGKDVIINTTTRASRNNSRGRRAETETQGLKKLEIVSTGLTIEEQNNVMSINTSRMNEVQIEILVPVKTNLNVEVVNGDKMLIDGVDGEIEAKNDNGDLTLTNVSGVVVAHSLNGDVIASLKRVTPDKAMSFLSMNGKVDVTLPGDTKANLKMRTDNGDVYTDFDVQIKPNNVPPVLEDQRKSGGRYRIQIEKSVLGAINGGGPDFELRTFNGNVYIRKTKP